MVPSTLLPIPTTRASVLFRQPWPSNCLIIVTVGFGSMELTFVWTPTRLPNSSACGSMPSIHMPLRHHPSSQTMRHVDSSQGRTEPNVAAAQHPLSRDNGSNGGKQPLIQVQDFQNHDWPSSRRPSVGNASISSRLKANTTPSMPDLYQHLKQVPIPPGSAIQWC